MTLCREALVILLARWTCSHKILSSLDKEGVFFLSLFHRCIFPCSQLFPFFFPQFPSISVSLPSLALFPTFLSLIHCHSKAPTTFLPFLLHPPPPSPLLYYSLSKLSVTFRSYLFMWTSVDLGSPYVLTILHIHNPTLSMECILFQTVELIGVSERSWLQIRSPSRHYKCMCEEAFNGC